MDELKTLSRRDFLKLAASGTLGFVLAEMGLDRALAAPPATHGRITWSGVPLMAEPFFNSKEIKKFGIDVSVRLSKEEEGDLGYGNPFNKTWYKVEDGYVYSGWIQPVEFNYQKPVYRLSHASGQVGEISVPFSITHLDPTIISKSGRRLYYGSTHWIKRVIVVREEKSIWYEIYDRYEESKHNNAAIYVPYHDMRLIPDEEFTTLSPEVPNADKLIHVDLSTQMVTAFEGNKLVFSSRCSSGGKGTRTPSGEFSTFHKWPSAHMTNQDEEGVKNNYYDLPGVPWTSYFTSQANAFHGTYWHNDYGRPRSHGCVNLKSEDAKWLYRWSLPNVPPDKEYLHAPGEGTRIQIV